MGYELTDHEWTAIKPMLPNKSSTWKPDFTSEKIDYRKQKCPQIARPAISLGEEQAHIPATVPAGESLPLISAALARPCRAEQHRDWESTRKLLGNLFEVACDRLDG
jgi:hypothetical protein